MKTLFATLLFVTGATSLLLAQDTTAVHVAATATTTVTEDFASYHPLVVHFPIVLLIVGAFMALINLFFQKRDFDIAVVGFAVTGALGCIVADQVHPHMVREVAPEIKAVFQEHDKYADLAKFASVLAGLILLAATFFYRKAWIKYIGIALLVTSAVFVSLAGHEGAKLVHLYDVGPKGNLLRTGPPQGPPPTKP